MQGEYDAGSLVHAIEASKKTIKELDIAIALEEKTISDYQKMLDDPKGHSYSDEGLARGIENGEKNIKVLKEAAADERSSIADKRIQIESLEKAKRNMEEAQANVHVEVVRDNTH